jgi:hypothetical protein
MLIYLPYRKGVVKGSKKLSMRILMLENLVRICTLEKRIRHKKLTTTCNHTLNLKNMFFEFFFSRFPTQFTFIQLTWLVIPKKNFK